MGTTLVAAANWCALWALVWFLTVYHLGTAPDRRRPTPAAPRMVDGSDGRGLARR